MREILRCLIRDHGVLTEDTHPEPELEDEETCYTGTGASPYDALEEALEQASGMGWEADDVGNTLDMGSKIPISANAETHHYVSVLLK